MEKITIIIFIMAVILYFFINVRNFKDFIKYFLYFIFFGSISFYLMFGESFLNKYGYFFKEKTEIKIENISVEKQKEVVEEKIIDKEAPKIKITYPEDGQIFNENVENITVKAEVWDAIDKNVTVDGIGNFKLEKGFNSIIVTSFDYSGNVGSAFIVVEKK